MDETSIVSPNANAPAFRAYPHVEKHATNGALLRNTIIGLADGLTVPFALTAGLSSIGSSRLVILGGLAELCSGAISMGLGAWLAATTERKHYEVEQQRELREIVEKPQEEEDEIYTILADYGLDRARVEPIVEGLKSNPDMWIKFMMDFELKLEKPSASGNWIAALVMGGSYFMGGLIPLIPYFAIRNVDYALFVSTGITAAILLMFGYIKAVLTGASQVTALSSAAQTLVVGAVAAGASYGIVRGMNLAVTLH